MREENLSLFLKRFPSLFFISSNWEQKQIVEEPLSLFPEESTQICYVYGLGGGAPYFELKKWLSFSNKRRLVFLEDDGDAVMSLLAKKEGGSIFQDEQVDFGWLEPKVFGSLADKYPVREIFVTKTGSKKDQKFRKIHLELLRKTALSEGIFVDRIQGHLLFSHFLQNVLKLPTSFYANSLRGTFSGVPAIICGAGPSLEEAIPILKTLESRAILIGVGSAIAALHRFGIKPHFCMAVDPNQEELERLKEAYPVGVPLLYSTRLFPEVLEVAKGPLGYMRTGIGGPLEIWIEEELQLRDPLLGKNLFSETTSVTPIALSFAEEMGCNPIFLVGVDLAYTKNRRYAAGISYKEGGAQDTENRHPFHKIVKRKNSQNQFVKTAIRWVMEAKSLAYFAKKNKKVSFYNTSELGMKISNIPFLPLKEGVDRYFQKEMPLRSLIEEAIQRSPMPQNSQEIVQTKCKELLMSLNRTRSHLEVILSQKGGAKALAEVELEEELAKHLLFFDMKTITSQMALKGDEISFFLEIAKKYLEGVYKARFSRFLGSFETIFDSFFGGNINRGI